MEKLQNENVAVQLKSAQDCCTQISPITSSYPDFNIAHAYEVSRILHELRLQDGWIPVGRKIGFTNSNMWPVFGVHEPVWAYMYNTTVTQCTGGQAKCFIGGYVQPKIEPEIVVHFCATPSVDATAVELLACIDWIALGFEVVQSHFADWQFQAADTIADRGLHAELFIGEPQLVDQLGQSVIQDLEQFEVTLSCDSVFRERGYGANVLGSPLKAVLHLLSVLQNQSGSEPIQAGEVVTTGTLTSAFDISVGQRWEASLKGIALPDLSVQIMD